MKKEIIHLASVLFTICFIVTLILALANYVTAPRIAQIKAETTTQMQKKVLPDADTFSQYDKDSRVVIGKSGDSFAGICVNVAPQGFGDTIEMIVGIDKSGVVSGVEILSFSETPGLGSKAKDASFLNQFQGKSGHLEVVKDGAAAENQIDAITAATITSKAVTQGVNDALSIYQDVVKGGEFNAE